ncbi:MAG: hypothetical protein QW582_03275, partial [Candidatus Micrarchaeaceae archaeon]
YSLGIYSLSNGTIFESSTSTPLSATITQTKATSIEYAALLYNGSASSPTIGNHSSQEPIITWSNYSVSVTSADGSSAQCNSGDQITATASPQFPSGYYLDLYDVTTSTMLCSTTSTSCTATAGIAGSTNFEACVSTSSNSLSNTAGCSSLSVGCHT